MQLKAMDDNNQLNRLENQLKELLQRQEAFAIEIQQLKREIDSLKGAETQQPTSPNPATPQPIPVVRPSQAPPSPFAPTSQPKKQQASPGPSLAMPPASTVQKTVSDAPRPSTPKSKSDLEKFIGENLINKIGIAILVIGVAIGAKYSIEHNLISPLTRIILGYLAGIGLLLIGFKLKKKYINYSAVLVSGAMTIMYFITYSAYAYYELFEQEIAFGLMAFFTVFTVLASMNYNKQIIAHIGLVGAYAVPFLLSDGSGRVVVLFTYMVIINAGILFISFRKDWKPLFIVAFSLSWIIYLAWFLFDYELDQHFSTASVFALLFFVQFYATFLSNKLIKKQPFFISDILLLFGNAFIFFGVGMALLGDHAIGSELLGVFTLANAMLHFVVSTMIYKSKLADKNLIYLTAGLVLVFLTITFPVQLDGEWVTVAWAVEAVLLFWIGRSKAVLVYEKLSYILMGLSLLSMVHDWSVQYENFAHSLSNPYAPLLNGHFVTAAVLVLALFVIRQINKKEAHHTEQLVRSGWIEMLTYAVPVCIVVISYAAFFIEIDLVFNTLFAASEIEVNPEGSAYPSTYLNYALKQFKVVWMSNYSMLFVLGLSVINMRWTRNRIFGIMNIALNAFTILVFLLIGLFNLSELRDTYIHQTLAEYYDRGLDFIIIRYISLALLFVLLAVTFLYVRMQFIKAKLNVAFEAFLYFVIWWVISSELIHWLDLMHFGQSYKLGLSILWGLYSLYIIIIGIWKRKPYLRIAALVLFGVTLIKLFLYDIAHLNTLSKTIVFISLGGILLIISFLYNKFKKNIEHGDQV